ncbi:hypothetical protein CHS0354_026465 [Potamilus streckersoni]|uniref:Uncharacterized protein n=1 Tax=Potamilus streckersoni TaxID=2493646 RepID=A0AAE0RQ49_9BIVA|nr:hypothetical protein CHS0354_026465 [Potamilus streckersoni]
MARTNYKIIEQPPHNYLTWCLINIIKLSNSDIKNNPVVNGFLKTTIGERIKQSKAVASDTDRPRYYKYNPDENRRGKTGANVEQLYKNEPRFRRCHEAIVDKFSNWNNIIERKEYQSDKILPREKLNADIHPVNLPDVVSESLSTTTAITNPVSGPDLRRDIESMITDKGYGATLTADDKYHPSKSDYTQTHPAWPKSDFLDDPR